MRLLFLLSTFFLCIISTAQEKTYQSLLLDKTLTDNADAVVRLDEMKIHIMASNKMTYVINQVVTILNKEGNRYATNRVFYDKEKKIKSLNLYIYDKLGKEIDHIKKKDFKDVSAADGFSLYNDDRLLVNRYTPTSYPYTISFSYAIETSDTGFFPPWNFLFGYKTSVEQSHYSISYANSLLKPEIKEYHLESISSSKKEEVGKITYEASNIPAIKYENLAPSFRNFAPRLKVRLKKFSLKGVAANVADWKDMGIWMNNSLLKGQDELSPSMSAIVKRLVAGVDDDLEKAKIIYKYVQDNTRYISVQIGIGGWKPISAIDVDRVKYGDCKGLSNYTHALLKAAGVQSYYTVIYAGKQKIDFEEDFAVLQGNHAILTIPYKDKYYWIDCTSQVNPFGFVGSFTDDRNALIMTPEGGKIIKTVAYLNEDNYQHTKTNYNIDVLGAITGSTSIASKGVTYYNRFRLEKYTKEDVIKYYKKHWSSINNLKIDKYSFTNDRDSIVFTEDVKINATNYGSVSGDRILFTVNTFNNSGYVPKRYRNRKLSFEIQRGYLHEDESTITLPEGYAIEAMPAEKTIQTEFGTYKVSFEVDTSKNTVLYQRRLFVKKGLYPKEKYAAYRDFRKEVARADAMQIVLVKK